MQRHVQLILLLALILALIAVFGCDIRTADAFGQYSSNKNATNCRACHGDFLASPYTSLSDGQTWGDSLHNVHRSLMLNSDCNVCHSGRKFPVYLDSSKGGSGLDPISCMGCHGRTEGAGAYGYGAGLRRHHTSAGVYICTECHTDSDPFYYIPTGEEVLPPYYANPGSNHPNIPGDPCNLDGGEDFAGSATGLDNNGDDLYDGLDNGCAAVRPDIAVSDSAAAANDLLIDFGPVTLGSSSDQLVTVTNAGSADLRLGSVASTDPLAAPFSIPAGGDDCSGALLAPSASCTLTVRFAPAAASAASESFDIPSDDPDENPVTFSLTGTGTPVPTPDIAVTDTVTPVDDLQVDFGVVTVGRSLDQLVTVRNAGSADLLLGDVAAADGLAAPFSIAPGGDTCTGALLMPSQSCTLTVRFAPDTAGAVSESFDIPSDDPDENPVTISLAGTGIANSPPSQPTLVSPADGATEVETTVTFEWDPVSDPDGDAVSYDLFVCTDSSFATCTPVNPAPITLAATLHHGAYASAGFGLACLGLALAGGIGRRRRLALLVALAFGLAVSLAACGGGGGGGGTTPTAPVTPDSPPLPTPYGLANYTPDSLAAGTTYYWKVVASDGLDTTDSEVRSFTTR